MEQQKPGIQNLDVKYDGTSEKVTISGSAPSQEAAGKAVLCCGNVSNAASVDNQLTVAQQAAEVAQFHDVVKGDTLSAISKKVLRRREQVQRHLRSKSPDALQPRQDLSGAEAVHSQADLSRLKCRAPTITCCGW